MLGLILKPVLRVVYKTDPVPHLMEFIMSEEAACKTEGVVSIRHWLLLGKGGGKHLF